MLAYVSLIFCRISAGFGPFQVSQWCAAGWTHHLPQTRTAHLCSWIPGWSICPLLPWGTGSGHGFLHQGVEGLGNGANIPNPPKLCGKIDMLPTNMLIRDANEQLGFQPNTIGENSSGFVHQNKSGGNHKRVLKQCFLVFLATSLCTWQVKPRRARTILWYNFLATGRGDRNALHAGCAVGENETKWSVNKQLDLNSWSVNHPERTWF